MSRPSYSQFYASMTKGGGDTPLSSNLWSIEMQPEQSVSLPLFVTSDRGSNPYDIGNITDERGILNFLVQQVTIPAFSGANTAAHETEGGTAAFNEFGIFKTDSNELTLSILQTESGMFENFFIPWMEEVNASEWRYASYPYTKYSITITQYRNDGKTVAYRYRYRGAYPKNVQTFNFSQRADNELTRGVTMMFSVCEVITNLKLDGTADGADARNPSFDSPVNFGNISDLSSAASAFV